VSTTGYIAAAWFGTFAAVAAYAAWIIRRSRRAAALVPEEDQRWM